MVIIFASSSTTGSVINGAGLGNEYLHEIGHFLMFMSLCLAYYRATGDIWVSIVFTMFFGVLDEIHQIAIPGRSSSLFDVRVDTLGAFVAGGFLWKLEKLKNWLRK